MEVCSSTECEAKALKACTKKGKCDHFCIGIRDEWDCPPCHHPECERGTSGKQTTEDFCNICWVETLGAAPCVYLSCGHTFHYLCILERLQRKWSGPSINFSYLTCPLCNTFISHPMLPLHEDQALYAEVKRKALERLYLEDMDEDEVVTSKEGRFYNDPAGYALSIFSFYKCFYCASPYFGGKRRCEEGLPVDNEVSDFDPKSYICSTCSTRVCPLHGDQGMMFKCRFCCNVATWFCFGNTHYCDKCHETPYIYCDGKGRLYATAANIKPCPGPESCPLGVKHPRHGVEYAFRCVLCEENGKAAELPKMKIEPVDEEDAEEEMLRMVDEPKEIAFPPPLEEQDPVSPPPQRSSLQLPQIVPQEVREARSESNVDEELIRLFEKVKSETARASRELEKEKGIDIEVVEEKTSLLSLCKNDEDEAQHLRPYAWIDQPSSPSGSTFPPSVSSSSCSCSALPLVSAASDSCGWNQATKPALPSPLSPPPPSTTQLSKAQSKEPDSEEDDWYDESYDSSEFD